jgi:molybdenum cofactor cytidylyltransferase
MSDDSESTTVAVVLAAGGGSRFHGPRHKLETEIDGVPVASHAVAQALAAGIGPVVVVTGAARLALPDPPPGGRLVEIHNARWADGQMTSIRAGLEAAHTFGAHAIVVGLADQPFVTAEAWRTVAASNSPIAVATYDGVRGNPVRLHESVWSLLPPDGDEGARTLIRLRPDLVEPVPCPGSAADIDTLEDLQRWQKNS